MKGCYTIQSCKSDIIDHLLLLTNQSANSLFLYVSLMADDSMQCFTQFQVSLALAAPTGVPHKEPPTQILPVRNVPNSLLQTTDFIKTYFVVSLQMF